MDGQLAFYISNVLASTHVKNTIFMYEKEMTLYLQRRPPIMVAYNNTMYYKI